jgi:hypothetical protein
MPMKDFLTSLRDMNGAVTVSLVRDDALSFIPIKPEKNKRLRKARFREPSHECPTVPLRKESTDDLRHLSSNKKKMMKEKIDPLQSFFDEIAPNRRPKKQDKTTTATVVRLKNQVNLKFFLENGKQPCVQRGEGTQHKTKKELLEFFDVVHDLLDTDSAMASSNARWTAKSA